MSETGAGRASRPLVVLATGPPPAVEALARRLVEERLAACVNVVPGVTSVYRWEGRVEAEREALAVIKTTEARIEALERRLVDLHPYEVPEFLVMEISRGSEAYLRWVRESVAGGSDDGSA